VIAGPRTAQQSAYMQAAAIADKALQARLPLIGFNSYDNVLIFRFGGERPQTVHMDAADADADKLIAAYQAFPP
jgi:hypothetical protein